MMDNDYVEPELPEGAIESHRITAVSYIDAEGENKYVVFAKGNAPATSYLGLTVVAQREVLDW